MREFLSCATASKAPFRHMAREARRAHSIARRGYMERATMVPTGGKKRGSPYVAGIFALCVTLDLCATVLLLQILHSLFLVVEHGCAKWLLSIHSNMGYRDDYCVL